MSNRKNLSRPAKKSTGRSKPDKKHKSAPSKRRARSHTFDDDSSSLDSITTSEPDEHNDDATASSTSITLEDNTSQPSEEAEDSVLDDTNGSLKRKASSDLDDDLDENTRIAEGLAKMKKAPKNSQGKKGTKKKAKEVKVKETPAWELPSPLTLVIPLPSKKKDMEAATIISVDLDPMPSFDDISSKIFETVGCENEKKKPTLHYKLQSSPKKERAISFNGDDDWDHCVERVKEAAQKKKCLLKKCPIEFFIDKDYMTKFATKKPAKKPKKKSVQDEEGDGDDDDNEDDSSAGESDSGSENMVAAQERELKKLDVARKCVLCGTTCLIDKHGQHNQLTFGQRRTWSYALMKKTPGVTLEKPPNVTSFERFHAQPAPPSQPNPAPMPPGAFNMPHMPGAGFSTPFMMNNQPFFPPFPGMPGHPMMMFPTTGGAPAAPPRRTDTHSSTQSDVSYPHISSFINKVVEKRAPLRDQLKLLPDLLHARDFHHIDEIKEFSKERWMELPYGLTEGNASFFVAALKKGVLRANREKRKETTG